MFLGRNRLGSVQPAPSEEGTAEGGTGFLNQDGVGYMPAGIQRFLVRKGINSSDDLFRRVKEVAPRIIFRR